MNKRFIYIFILFFVLVVAGEREVKAETKATLPFKQPGIAYQPKGFSPDLANNGLSRKGLRQDIRSLKNAGFQSIVTYGAQGLLADIPVIALTEGFHTIIMGVWDPLSEAELENAIKQKNYVTGYCVGNEGLGKRYSQTQLGVAMNHIREKTGLPVTTSEPVNKYFNGPHKDWLIRNSDWIFPNAHPFWSNQFDAEQAANWIVTRYDYLAATSNKKIILKEAGFPSFGRDGFTEKKQLAFFQKLHKKLILYFYFEAFDQPWKQAAKEKDKSEAHWGLYTSEGFPKKTVEWLRKNGHLH